MSPISRRVATPWSHAWSTTDIALTRNTVPAQVRCYFSSNLKDPTSLSVLHRMPHPSETELKRNAHILTAAFFEAAKHPCPNTLNVL